MSDHPQLIAQPISQERKLDQLLCVVEENKDKLCRQKFEALCKDYEPPGSDFPCFSLQYDFEKEGNRFYAHDEIPMDFFVHWIVKMHKAGKVLLKEDCLHRIWVCKSDSYDG